MRAWAWVVAVRRFTVPADAGEGAEVDLVEVVAHVPPRVPGAGFGDTDQQEGEPAQHDVDA